MKNESTDRAVAALRRDPNATEVILDKLDGDIEIVVTRAPLERGFVEDGLLVRKRLAIQIRVGEFSTHNQVRAAIPTALQRREELAGHQSPWLRTPNETLGFLARLEKVHGFTHAQAAERLNEISAIELMRCDRLGLDPRDRLDFLRDLGIGEEELTVLIDAGLAALKRGDKPFEAGYPVDLERVKGALKKWRRKSKTRR
jgi:hypothetical protein